MPADHVGNWYEQRYGELRLSVRLTEKYSLPWLKLDEYNHTVSLLNSCTSYEEDRLAVFNMT